MQNIRVDLGASARCIWLYMTPLVYESKGDSDQYVQLIWTYEPAHAMWYMWLRRAYENAHSRQSLHYSHTQSDTDKDSDQR